MGRPDEKPSLQKLYYRIGEVAQLVGVETHVLRYWESEFPTIRPQKSRSGQRVYSRKDVTKLLRVKELLYAERFTIEGARQRLRVRDEEPVPVPEAAVCAAKVSRVREVLLSARREVLEAIAQLGGGGPADCDVAGETPAVPQTTRCASPHGDQAAAGRGAEADRGAEVWTSVARRGEGSVSVRR